MEKQRWEEPEKRRAEVRRLEKIEKRKGKTKEDSRARKIGKSRKTVFFSTDLCLWRVEK